MKIKYEQDLYAEQILKKYGLKWTEEEVPFSKVDHEKSSKNFARLGSSLDQDVVVGIAVGIENGMAIPMMVCFRGHKYVIASGRHRSEACKLAGAETFKAYVVESTDEKILLTLPAALNPPRVSTSHGERMALAVRAHLDGMSINEAADLFSFGAPSLATAVRMHGMREELQRLGFSHQAWVDKTILVMSPFRNNANVLKRLAQSVSLGKLNSSEADELCKRVKRERTEAQQIAAIEQFESENGVDPSSPRNIEKTRVKNPLENKKRAVKVALGTLEGHINVRTIRQWGITEKAEVDSIKKRIIAIAGRLAEIGKRS